MLGRVGGVNSNPSNKLKSSCTPEKQPVSTGCFDAARSGSGAQQKLSTPPRLDPASSTLFAPHKESGANIGIKPLPREANFSTNICIDSSDTLLRIGNNREPFPSEFQVRSYYDNSNRYVYISRFDSSTRFLCILYDGCCKVYIVPDATTGYVGETIIGIGKPSLSFSKDGDLLLKVLDSRVVPNVYTVYTIYSSVTCPYKIPDVYKHVILKDIQLEGNMILRENSKGELHSTSFFIERNPLSDTETIIHSEEQQITILFGEENHTFNITVTYSDGSQQQHAYPTKPVLSFDEDMSNLRISPMSLNDSENS